MSDSIVRDAIAEELALLEPVASFPTGPLGYGTDISCDTDLDENMVEIDGMFTLILAQALFRRLITTRGSLPDDANYGLDVRAYCNKATTTNEIKSLAGRIKVELEKDDRVDTVLVEVTPSSDARTLTISIQVNPIDARVGGFSMTMVASDSAALLEEIAA